MAAPIPNLPASPYPTTGSSLTDNKTNVSLSTMIVIKVNDNPVGAIQKLSINESREISTFDEVGRDGHIDSAPTKSADITGSCERIRFDRLKIAEAFSRGFVHAKSQRVPFEIHIIDTMAGDVESGSAVVTVIKNVWIKNISYAFDATNWAISDSMDWVAEDIYSIMAGSGAPVAQRGIRELKGIEYDIYELAADMGKRSGALDAPDLINAPLLAT